MRFLILILLALLFSCKTGRQKGNNARKAHPSQECLELINFLKTSWKQTEDGVYYFKEKPQDRRKIHNSKHMENCLRGKTKKEIQKLLGKPSAQIYNRFYYYMSKECLQGSPPDNFNRRCILLIIYFDDNNQVGGTSAILPYRPPVH